MHVHIFTWWKWARPRYWSSPLIQTPTHTLECKNPVYTILITIIHALPSTLSSFYFLSLTSSMRTILCMINLCIVTNPLQSIICHSRVQPHVKDRSKLGQPEFLCTLTLTLPAHHLLLPHPIFNGHFSVSYVSDWWRSRYISLMWEKGANMCTLEICAL